MAIHLARPINIYFASENAHDAGSLDRCFAADAMVRDEGRTIQRYRRDQGMAKRDRREVPPHRRAAQRHRASGKTVVTAKVSGNFPGSPVNLDHVFELHGDKIVSLEIH